MSKSNSEWYVTYGDNYVGGVSRRWNCDDSEVEANRVFEYMKYTYNVVRKYHNDELVEEWKYYSEDEGL